MGSRKNKIKIYTRSFVAQYQVNKEKDEGETGDSRRSDKIKGKVIISHVTTTYIYGLDTMTMTGYQRETAQFYINNCTRGLASRK